MDISVTCQCGKRLQVPRQYAGQTGQCPTCGRVLHLPDADGSHVPPTPSRPIPPPLPVQPPRIPVADEQPHEMVSHNGEPLYDDFDFFVSPPPEIGQVQTGYSTLRHGVEPMADGTRYLLVVVVATVCLFLGFTFVLLTKSWLALIATLGVAALGFALTWYFTRFTHTCTYVGRDGVAEFRCAGRREHITPQRVFLFHHAVELRTSQTRHYVNGAYSGTNYTFTWTDEHGRVVYQLKGRYHSEAGKPKAKDLFHYALSAEIWWSLYLMDSSADELEQEGSIEFGLKGRDWIRVGPGLVILRTRGETIELRGEDIARIRIEQGTVSIMEPGAKEGWFSSTGVYKFPYQDLGNARFFLFLMDRLVGVR